MLFYELLIVYGCDERRYQLVVYRQPMHDRLIASLYTRWTLMTWRLLWPVESLFARRHERSCDEDCEITLAGTMGKVTTVCGYIPLTNRQDLRLHDLNHRRREELAFLDIPEDTYRRLAGGA